MTYAAQRVALTGLAAANAALAINSGLAASMPPGESAFNDHERTRFVLVASGIGLAGVLAGCQSPPPAAHNNPPPPNQLNCPPGSQSEFCRTIASVEQRVDKIRDGVDSYDSGNAGIDAMFLGAGLFIGALAAMVTMKWRSWHKKKQVEATNPSPPPPPPSAGTPGVST